MTPAPTGRDVFIKLNGFEATLTEYIPIYGYETSFVGGGRHGRRNRPMGRDVRTTEMRIPRIHITKAYLEKASNILEENGYILRKDPAEYTVDVAFGGPFVSSGETFAEFMWMLSSVFSAEYAVQNWSAKLKVYDNKTGRLIFTKDYKQKYDAAVWSPLFFIGLSGSEETTFNFIQNWALASLTEQTMADATAFLSTQIK